MGLQKMLLKGGKIAAYQLAPDALNLAAKIGSEIIEKQKTLIKVPNLKDVNIGEALRILKDELNLIPAPAVATPCLGYADATENDVVYTKPRAGVRINPRTTIRVYYLTQEVINRSNAMKVHKEKDKQERIDKIVKSTKAASETIHNGAADFSQKITITIKKPFLKNRNR